MFCFLSSMPVIIPELLVLQFSIRRPSLNHQLSIHLLSDIRHSLISLFSVVHQPYISLHQLPIGHPSAICQSFSIGSSAISPSRISHTSNVRRSTSRHPSVINQFFFCRPSVVHQSSLVAHRSSISYLSVIQQSFFSNLSVVHHHPLVIH